MWTNYADDVSACIETFHVFICEIYFYVFVINLTCKVNAASILRKARSISFLFAFTTFRLSRAVDVAWPTWRLCVC